MRGELVTGTGIALFVIIVTVSFMPVVHAQDYDPDYNLAFWATSSKSAYWNDILFGVRIGSTRFYGNFCIELSNPRNIDYVIFSHTLGANNHSPSWHRYDGDLLLNDSEEPYEWVLNTMNFSVGLHQFHWMAWRDTGWSIVGVGGAFTLYLEHEDRSQDALLYSGLSTGLAIGLLTAGVPIALVVIYMRHKKHSREEHGPENKEDLSPG